MARDEEYKRIEEERKEAYKEKIKRIKSKRSFIRSIYKWMFMIMLILTLLCLGADAYSNGKFAKIQAIFTSHSEEMPFLNDDSVFMGEEAAETTEDGEE